MSLIEASSGQCKTMADGSLRLTFDVPPARAADAFKLFGTPGVPSVLGRLTTESEKTTIAQREAKKEPNYFAQKLFKNGHFNNPKLWLAVHDHRIYTLQAHKAWIETLPCTFAGNGCRGDVCAHHADRSESLVGGPERQPEAPQKGLHFYCVPLCFGHHDWVHHDATRDEKRGLLEVAVGKAADRIALAIKAHLKLTSWSDVTPEMLMAFETEIGL